MEQSYQTLLGHDWDLLPPAVRLSLSPPVRAKGVLKVDVANRGLAGFLARRIKLPPPGEEVPATLEVVETAEGIKWTRTFGSMQAVSYQRILESSVIEVVPPWRIELSMATSDGIVIARQTRLRLFGATVPAIFGPRVSGEISAGMDGRTWRVKVSIGHDWFGTLCRYEGPMCISQSGY